MSNQLKLIYDSNINLILQNGVPWSRYIVLKDIIRIRDVKRLSRVKNEIIKDSRIEAIYEKLSDPQLGVPSISSLPVSHKVYGSYYWGLRFLADIGLSSTDLPLDRVVHQISIHQLPDGQFTIAYHRKDKNPVTAVCLTANLAYSLAKLGYQDSRAVRAAINYILTTQRKDGGWHCDWKKQIGERDQDALSCLAANINVIRALAINKDCPQHILKGAIMQIFNQWKNPPNNFELCDSGIGTIYLKLRYPPHYWSFDILNILDTLSFHPEFCRNQIFDEMIQQVLSKWDGKGLFKSEKSIPGWRKFDFANNNSYSSWISCLICRILARIYFKGK